MVCRADREFQKTNEKPPIVIVPAAATACLNQLNARVCPVLHVLLLLITSSSAL